MPNTPMSLFILEAINMQQSNIMLKDAMNITYQFLDTKTHSEVLKLEEQLYKEEIAISFHHDKIFIKDIF